MKNELDTITGGISHYHEPKTGESRLSTSNDYLKETNTFESITGSYIPSIEAVQEAITITPKMADSLEGVMILRTHYSREIINILDWLKENHETKEPKSLNHLNSLLKIIKDYCDNFHYDPYAGFLSALYDSIIIENFGLNLSKEIYGKIIDLIKALNNQKLTVKKINKYISKLSDLGLDILPY